MVGLVARSEHSTYRTLMAVDIESYGLLERSDRFRIQLRRRLNEWCVDLLSKSEANAGRWHLQDTGDGFLLSIDPNVPRSLLLAVIPSGLRERLLAYNRDRVVAERFRVRLAMHAGDVLGDPDPFIGEATNHVCRLLDSDVLRACLQATLQPVVVMVSEAIYRGIVKHAHGDLDPAAWHRVVAYGKEGPADAWVYVPGDTDAPTRVSAAGAAWAPYLGLASFQPADAERFFGRERLVADLVDRLEERRFLAVVGPSGSGKSSLLRAGLLPAVRSGKLPDSQDWPTVLLTPGEHPLEELAVHIGALQGVAAGALRSDLGSRPADLDLAIRQALIGRPPSVQTLLVVDQFEEVFILCSDERERTAFINALLGAVNGPRSRAKIVLGVRADFYAWCGERPALVAALQDAQLLVSPMTEGELRAAITEPAARAGVTVEAALVETALGDARSEPGALPLLSHALLTTWQRRKGRRLTLADYLAAGGVQAAVSQTAEEVYSEFDPAQRQIAKGVFLRLTVIGEGMQDTKRRASLSELYAGTGGAAATATVLERLAAARLITLDKDSAQVTHEALIRSWPRLQEWLTDDRAWLRVHQRLTHHAQEWEALGREPDALYRGVRLAEAQTWAGDPRHDCDLTALERAFLDTSLQLEVDEQRAAQRRTQRLHQLVAALASLLALMLFASGFALQRTQELIRQRNLTISGQLVAVADRLREGGNPALAAQFYVSALHFAQTLDTRSRVLTAVAAPNAGRLLGHTNIVYRGAFSPDGRLLATAGFDGTARLWDVAARTELRILPGHTSFVLATAFSPDGRMVATGSADGTIRFWGAASGARLATLVGRDGSVRDVVFSPDGRTLATANSGGTVNLWDVNRRLRIAKLAGLVGPALALAFSPDGRTLATAGADQTVRLWDVARRTVSANLTDHTGAVYGVAFSPDGRTVASASADQTVRLWDVARRTLSANLTGHSRLFGVAFSRDGRLLATTGDQGTVLLWDIRGSTLVGHTGPVRGVAFSPDGRVLASASNDGTMRLWDVARHLQLAEFTGHTSLVSSVAFSPDGRVLASASNDGTMRLWDVARHLQLAEFTGHTGTVSSVAFSPDGRVLASASSDETVRLWDVARRRQLAVLSGHTGAVDGVAFSPDGRMVATGGADRTVRLWDVAKGTQLAILTGHIGLVFDVAFSKNGRTLASTGDDGTVRLWDVARRRQLAVLSGHTGAVDGVAFSPDGRMVATGGADRTVRLWDVAKGTQLAILTGHTGPVLGTTFSPDGRMLATSGEDMTVRLWDTDAGRAAAQICATGAPISRAEWARYVPNVPYEGTCRR